MNWGELGITFFKSAASSAIAGIISFFTIPLLIKLNSLYGGKFLSIIVLLAFFGIIYLITNLLLRTAELHEFLSLLKRRGKKN